MKYEPGLWLFLLASAIIAGLLVYSWRFRKTETGLAFVRLMMCGLIWVAGFSAEIASTSLELKVFLSDLQFLGITFLPVTWLFLVLAYTGQSISRRSKFLLILLPITTNLVIWTNPLHHWFRGYPSLDYTSGPFPVLDQDYQFWFYNIHALGAYLYMGVAILILGRAMRKMDAIYQRQSMLLFIAILLPAITDIAYVMGYSPTRYYNYATAIFSISGIILTWALFRYQFLDLVPLARSAVIDNLIDGVIVLDAKNRMVDFNPAAEKIFKISKSQVGLPIREIKNEFLDQIDPFLRSDQTEMDIEIGKSSHQYYDLRISPVFSPHGTQIGRVITSRDVTDRVELFKQVQENSIRDGLTGIYNQRHFLDLCVTEIQRITRGAGYCSAVIMIDLDHFKLINDAHGHACGDQVLVSFCQVIQNQLRPFDIFGRIGGEEFAIFLNHVTSEQALAIAERLRLSTEAMRVTLGDKEITVTASFGVVLCQQVEESDLDIKKLLKYADEALYQAKRAGRNCVYLYQP